MTNRVAGKIKLQSVDQLLGVPEISGTQEIEIVRIHAFPNHPFKVLDDERSFKYLCTCLGLSPHSSLMTSTLFFPVR